MASCPADHGVIDVGDAVAREQAREDAPVLAGLGGGEALQVADGQAQVEPDTEDVTGADAGAGEDQQLVLGQDPPQLVDQRQDRVGAAVNDRASADLDYGEPGQQADGLPDGGRPGQVGVEEGLAGEQRLDVLLPGCGGGHAQSSSVGGDACRRARRRGRG